MNHSDLYREQLATAISESTKLGFLRPPVISAQEPVPNDLLRFASELVAERSGFLDFLVPGYWGNDCQTLSSNIFATLAAVDIPVNIVFGDVLVQGQSEFDCTLDDLRQEFLSTEPRTGAQNVHAWVSLGDDTIIDAALLPRVHRLYEGAPEEFRDMILMGRAVEWAFRADVQYVPLLVGTEFLARTNPPDPMALLDAVKAKMQR